MSNVYPYIKISKENSTIILDILAELKKYGYQIIHKNPKKNISYLMHRYPDSNYFDIVIDDCLNFGKVCVYWEGGRSAQAPRYLIDDLNTFLDTCAKLIGYKDPNAETYLLTISN